MACFQNVNPRAIADDQDEPTLDAGLLSKDEFMDLLAVLLGARPIPEEMDREPEQDEV